MKEIMIFDDHFSQFSRIDFTASSKIPVSKLFDHLFIEPTMSKKEKELFYKYLDLSHIFFEFGSGGSTYQAIKRNIKTYSVESDAAWHDRMKKDIINITNQINNKRVFHPDIT